MAEQQRIPRVNKNIRNESNELFKFGGVHDYRNEDKRFFRDIATEEKEFQKEKKEKKLHQDEVRREFISEFEERRWANYADSLAKDQATVDRRKKLHPSGKSGAGYNIITNQYLETEAGQQLKHMEQESFSTKERNAVDIYLKNNTYNPVQGYDVSSSFKQI